MKTEMKPKELGISIKEMNALRKVRDGLREGRFRHVTSPELDEDAKVKKDKPLFNMEKACATGYECGTVACIGGWVALQMKIAPEEAAKYVYDGRSTSLDKLYFPDVVKEWDLITPKKAAKAIDNFLTTGDPQWRKVVGNV